MKKGLLAVIVGFLFISGGCIFEEDPIVGTLILDNGASPEDWLMDPYTYEEARVEGDLLLLTASYPGGCEEHEFALVAWSYFMESYPVQAALLLSHDSNGDMCEAHIVADMEFDLTPLKEEYQASYQQEEGTIILKLLLPEGEYEYLTVEYTF